MNLDQSSFLAGIEKKADELFLTKNIKNFILEKAGLFNTKDTANDIANMPGAMDSEMNANLAVLSRAYPDLLAGGGLGAGAGAGIGSLLSQKPENKKRNILLGGIGGAGLGAGAAGLNYLKQVFDNSNNVEE